MITLWMAYSLVLSGLVGLTAFALERVAALWDLPRRFVWCAAVLASMLVPPLVLVLARTPSSGPAAPRTAAAPAATAAARPVAAAPLAAPAIAFVNGITPGAAALDTPLLLLWGATSLLLALGLVRAGVVLRRRARTWSATVVDGMPVLVAPDIGPAVVRWSGLRMVLPAWALEAEATARSLMLRHETEHCRARDPDLLLGATLALVVAPWNVALWWQVRRLQLAVETDCDARVMRGGADARAYGALLLRVGARHAWQPLLAATPFAEEPSLLRRRIETMTSSRPRNPMMRAAAATGVAVIAVAVAGMVPRPAGISPAAVGGAKRLAAGPQGATCTDTMGLQLHVSRAPGAPAVSDEDLAGVLRLAATMHGYSPLLDPAGAHAPVYLEVSLELQPGHAQVGTVVTRVGAAGSHGSSLQSALPTTAGSATVGSMLGRGIDEALTHLPLGDCVDLSNFASELPTPAATEVVRLHGAAIGRLSRPADAGIWLVQDSTGMRISSGVLENFPSSISSKNYQTVVPGASATGQDAIAFGFGRTPVVGGAGPFKIVFVTVARRP